MGSFAEGSQNPTTQTSTPKFVDKVVVEVMQIDKIVKLFQTMAIVSLNMRNLNLEASSLKNRLAIEEKEKEKEILQVELDKERDFQREYKHDIKIWMKNKTKNGQKIKTLIEKLQDDNKELKANILYTLISKGFVVENLSQNNFRHSL